MVVSWPNMRSSSAFMAAGSVTVLNMDIDAPEEVSDTKLIQCCR